MKCPECGNCNAYMGFSSIDCPNTDCRFYQGSSDLDVQIDHGVTSPGGLAGPQGSPGNVSPSPAQGSTGSATLAPPLRVSITSQQAKRSSVEIKFIAYGDPGKPDKKVEFLWSLPGQNHNVICTLSARHTYYVAGVDADGNTTYTTQWKCLNDGVNPNDPFTLHCRIFV